MFIGSALCEISESNLVYIYYVYPIVHHSQIKIVFLHLSHPRITNIGSIAGHDLGGQAVVCVVKTFLKHECSEKGT